MQMFMWIRALTEPSCWVTLVILLSFEGPVYGIERDQFALEIQRKYGHFCLIQ